MPRATRRLATALALVMLTAGLAGCAFLGGGASSGPTDVAPDDPAWQGPHVALVVDNGAPGDARVDYRLLDADGEVHAEGGVDAPAGQAVRAPVPLRDGNGLRLQLGYSWTADGRGSSGSNEAAIDPASCAGTLTVELRLETAEDGRAVSSVATTCAAGE